MNDKLLRGLVFGLTFMLYLFAIGAIVVVLTTR